MATVELDVEVPDLATVEIETVDVNITPSAGNTVLLVVAPGEPGPPGPPGEGVVVMGEVPGGARNDSNVVYTTANKFLSNSTGVYLNGLRQVRGPHYTETTDQSITLDDPPSAADTLTIDYTVKAT